MIASGPGHVRLRAQDVMTSPVITVRPEAAVKDAAAMMLAHHVSGLPVLTGEGELVGIVTEADLLHKETTPRPRGWLGRLVPPSSRRAEEMRRAEGLTVRDVMTSPVAVVTEETPVHEIANLVVRRQINRVPVTRDGRVVGIVSRADILRAFARSDEEIARAIRDALLHELWVDVSALTIEVHQGVVSLRGEVDRLSEKHLAERWAATIDGVVKVDSHLTYRIDDRAFARHSALGRAS